MTGSLDAQTVRDAEQIEMALNRLAAYGAMGDAGFKRASVPRSEAHAALAGLVASVEALTSDNAEYEQVANTMLDALLLIDAGPSDPAMAGDAAWSHGVVVSALASLQERRGMGPGWASRPGSEVPTYVAGRGE